MSRYTDLDDWCVPAQGFDYRTTKPVQWEIGAVGSGLWLRVPTGFRFNISVPVCLWWAVQPDNEKFLKAACLHDYALRIGWSRVAAAAAFSEALRADRVGVLKRLAAVLAVIIWKWS